ncbi:auxin response factor 17-like [Salvia splendens]|uniref:auxin response factor 17-like n=1 Tax=Salvia splendens TaxID=180675 RepID=UPI001C274A51|nr:auxin response factor 17-like [Salvia splendens]
MSINSTAAVEVDSAVWHAVAGAEVHIPAINSYVYYFPQGHLENVSATPAPAAAYNFNLMRPWIPCQVISVRFLSDPVTDQVFSKVLLQPLQPLGHRQNNALNFAESDVVTYAKVLTRSDANNGGGFSVPRFCADMILPQLDFEADPPAQNLLLRDTLGHAWEFRHIFRGTPRRHLLTSGWSRFVNAKSLIAGDAVVFMKKRSTGDLYLGIRRAVTFVGAGGGADTGAVVGAVQRAGRGLVFEVVYYPKAGSPDFIVMAEKVKESLQMRWVAGMKVKMQVETEDASRMTWMLGVVTAAATPVSGVWCGSPWRMLKVNWEDPEGSEEITTRTVNPWQVDYIPFSPLMAPGFHPAKRLKFLQNNGNYFPPANHFAGNPSAAAAPIFDFSHYMGREPAAGARYQLQPALNNLHRAIENFQPAMINNILPEMVLNRVHHPPGLHNLQLQAAANNDVRLPAPANNVVQPPAEAVNNEAEQDLISVSKALSIGSSSEIMSPVSQGSVQGATSFLLFGKTIEMAGDEEGEEGESGAGGEGGDDGGESCG